MMRRSIFALALILLAGTAQAAKVEFVLANSRVGLAMYLLNSGTNPIEVNKRFALAETNEPGNAEVYLEVQDRQGKVYPLQMAAAAVMPMPRDFTLVRPEDFIGRVIRYPLVKSFYGLPTGDYRMRAIYRNTQPGQGETFIGELDSGWIDVRID